ncbi:hypothetical protein DCS_00980 [Drechmeria coniospora]|uniref:DNA/RNA helicase, DEAD/DEAH box type n=1 Tax=Drechmeria coniospora TaxID=98403 RepID=A0A151GRW6_DRECN|nr:hypothetical protein DCS_00980 [Drechmeria coniospora]KYK59846.1 hypothetical protein DCS_00980 [Drechmeria coniospora]ODA78644.1 hypothetical protein RJ55_06026 [Drechmeria coniospora]
MSSRPRKRQAESAPPTPEAKPVGKKRKTKRSKHDDEAYDVELGINKLIARMDNQLLADHLAQQVAKFGKDLSSVELSDLTVSASSICETTAWADARTTEKLADFLEEHADNPASLKRAPKKNGAPHTIIVTGAGQRAADVARHEPPEPPGPAGRPWPPPLCCISRLTSMSRVVRKFACGKDDTVAKLFAKHMKVEEQIAFLQNRKSGIGVGTPARLFELIKHGALSLENLQRLVVDASHIDGKKRGVMDMKDTLMPLARLLAADELKTRYEDEKKPLALLFY